MFYNGLYKQRQNINRRKPLMYAVFQGLILLFFAL